MRILSCMLLPPVGVCVVLCVFSRSLFFLSFCHTLGLYFHCCLCECMPQRGAMFCLYVKSPIYDILT